MEKIKAITDILDSLNVKDLAIYDFEQASPYYDYFVLATINDRQAAAAANKLKNADISIRNIEGKGGGWILIDLGDVVVHLFKQQEREFYDFDRRLIGVKRIK